MVNEKRIERKLAGILVDAPATTHQGSLDYKKKERAITKFKRKNPRRFRDLMFHLVKAFNALDTEITEQTRKEIDAFDKSFEAKREN